MLDLNHPSLRGAVDILADQLPRFITEVADDDRRTNLQKMFAGLTEAATQRQRRDMLKRNAAYTGVDRYLGATLSSLGFALDEVRKDLMYMDRPAWAVFYRRDDCKLQVCWSAREGSTDLMLAKPDAPNTYGLEHAGKDWHFLLELSGIDDGFVTPAIDADAQTWWGWRNAMVEAHLPSALRVLSDRA
jgi:hypothetical protein